MHASLLRNARNAIPLHATTTAGLKRFLEKRSKRDAAYLKASGFTAADGQMRLIQNATGGIAAAVLGLGKGEDNLALAHFSEQLPAGVYAFG
ncbi:MAG: hypothetical protein JO348_08435, partial [Alphaproteobacteria bacterium]|nr:hypothetical protein [Alphaproteobacteria bacterium]MBV9419786.1 hypothetical protein [Alphaproteobacteria bacterium]